MNRNRMLVLAIVALLLSVGVTYFAFRLLKSRLQPVDETTQIAVATEKLPMGTRLTEKLVKMTSWPKSTPLQGSFSDTTQMLGRAVLVETLPNEPILESRLAPKEAGAGLMVAIPEGMRAISIQVNNIIGVTGFVAPGSLVDLILTTMPPKEVKKNIKGTPGETGSKIVLENLKILAVGQNVQRDVEGKPQSVAEVTLLVTPEQASKIALATGDGRIQLALRNPLDHEAVDPPLIFKSALYEGPGVEIKAKAKTLDEPEKKPPVQGSGQKKKAPMAGVAKATPPPPPPTIAPPPPPRIVAVELIQGIRRATETFEEKTVGSEEKKSFEEKKP